MHHLDRLLTSDQSSRKHKTHTRLSLTATYTQALTKPINITSWAHTYEMRGAWQKTHHLDRLLTMNGSSRQHKTHSYKAFTHCYTYTNIHKNCVLHTPWLFTITLSGNAGCETKDASTWQTADNGRISQTVQDPHKASAHCYTYTSCHKSYAHHKLSSHSRNMGCLTKDTSSWLTADNGWIIQTAQEAYKAFSHCYTYTSCHKSYTHYKHSRNVETHHLDRHYPDCTRPMHTRLLLTVTHTQAFTKAMHTCS